MFENIIPLRNEVKVRALPEGDVKNELGIFIPAGHNAFANKLFKAEILEAGPEVVTMCCRDIAVCQYNSGIEVAPDIILIKETDIVGILEHRTCSAKECCKQSASEITD